MNTWAIGILLTIAAGDITDAIRKDTAALQGVWQVTASEQGGEKVPAADIKDLTLIFKDDAIFVREGGKTEEWSSFRINPSKAPKEIDLTVKFGPNKGRVDRAIYQIEGNALRICIQSNKDAPRPRAFSTQSGSKMWLVDLQRSK